jgi:hypothetical protein
MKQKLTTEQVEKMTWNEIIRYYFPGATDEYCDYLLWSETPFPFNNEKAMEMIYKKYEGICKLLGI